VAKGDHDYANQLLSQCVSEDPANLIYLQSFLTNLRDKYNDNKKGTKFASLKIKSHRSALNKGAAGGDWMTAFQAGCAALALNPWDTTTLLAMAAACQELHINECQLFYLRWALDSSGKDPQVNRQAALALQRMGQFDQAIACWHRVEQAKPHDEEALQAISRLAVEKTIQQGGYDPALLSGGGENGGEEGHLSVARLAVGGSAANDPAAPPLPLEQRLLASIQQEPAEIAHYLQLADLLMHENRLDDAEKVLSKAMQASGGGDYQVHLRQEDLQIRLARQQLAIAERQITEQPSAEADHLVVQLRAHVNQVELEVFSARADREPQNGRFQYELGLRLKRAGKFKQAIPALQAARSDSKHRIQVLLDLGECFQKIEQYKLALSHYEQAIELSKEERKESETGKMALYRAGVLATGLRELDRAEQHLTQLAGLDFSFRDVAERLDKLNKLRDSG
jgi:tetratricopeptide (TPR) repeat protein